MWWARPDDWRPELESLLDNAERERLGRLRRRRDRERFVVGAALARTIVADYAGTAPARIGLDRTCADCGAAHGKPRVIGCDDAVELSISHSGDRVVVAIALGKAVGVDVESPRDDAAQLLELVDDVLRPEEARRLRALPANEQAAGFLTYWTRKESLLKATGEGLRLGLASVAVTGPGEPPRLLGWSEATGNVEGATLADLRPGAGYVACLAVLGGVTHVVEECASDRLASIAA